MPTPTRKTAETALDQWNDQLRASPIWQTWMQQRGKIQGGQMVGLSDREQEEFERHLAQNGIKIPSGMHIDQGGNLNQKNRLLRNIGIGAAIGGGALTGLGLAGIGPLGGLGGGAAASGGAAGASGAAGGVLPSSSFPVASLMGGPAAIASQGASAGIGAGIGAGAGAAADYLGDKPKGRGVLGTIGDAAKQFNPWQQAAFAALAGLPGLLAANRGGPSDEEKALFDQARQMQAMQQRRIEAQNPLFEAVTQLAMSRLPTASQRELKPL